MPSIVSGDKLAYLDPQEKIWKGESGQEFDLEKLLNTNHVSPFHGLADFDSSRTFNYQKTLFRFPLRTSPSDLSENVYTLDKVQELINALKADANLLLVFLRSVVSIEVYEIDRHENKTLLFQTKIADSFLPDLSKKRSKLLQEVESSYEMHEYNSTSIHTFMAKFNISMYMKDSGKTTTTHWLVANQVGSSIPKVRDASVKQKVFPWVGTALELDNPGYGRVFCFLPMPIEAASNLPVHINGTFGLNDDRRCLKWPGIERQNDPTANWNYLLVKDVLPSCYLSLLLEAKKAMDSDCFYKAWPVVEILKSSNWEGLLQPLFNDLLVNTVVWSDTAEQHGEWVLPTSATYVPRSVDRLESIVEKTLTSCGVKLAKVPEGVWSSFVFADVKVNEVNPEFVRDAMRTNIDSYRSIGSVGKLELLKYCLSDADYRDLNELELLPLANDCFIPFQSQDFISSKNPVYLCTSENPRTLLPNLDHKLVDVSGDEKLHSSMLEVINSNETQLELLTLNQIAILIDKAMPIQWKHLQIVDFPCNELFPTNWFKIFWEWISKENLELFLNKLVVPVQNKSSPNKFSVIRLTQDQAVLYIPCNQVVYPEMTSLLAKYEVMCSPQNLFPYLCHADLKSYILSFNPSNVLAVICKNNRYGEVKLTPKEACHLKTTVAVERYPDPKVLRNIKFFKTSKNTGGEFLSICDVCRQSVLQQCVIEPPGSQKLISTLPNTIILFENDSVQVDLLGKLNIHAETQADFVVKFIFPSIQDGTINDHSIDSIMVCVLDTYYVLHYQNTLIDKSIQNLQFVKDGTVLRKQPHDLFNPRNHSISLMFEGEKRFPEIPYSNPNCIEILKKCGLRNSVSAQEILNLILSISYCALREPLRVSRAKIIRARAIIDYIQKPDFKRKIMGKFKVGNRSNLPFDKALLFLSKNRSWLPVEATAPYNYPRCLPWKGSGYSSHFISLNSKTAVSCSSNPTLPLLYGSQAYFTEPFVNDDELFQLLSSHQPSACLLPHFQKIVSHKNDIPANNLLNLVCHTYSAMQEILKNGETDHIIDLKNMKEWVYISKYKRFVEIKVVAEQENFCFHQNMEPYLYVLPESISRYSTLFKYFGMGEYISQDQIASILSAMKDQIGSEHYPPSSKTMWSTLMAILNWLTNNGTKVISSSIHPVLVPAESDSEWPDLRKAQELVYTDNEYLKSFNISSSEKEPTLTFVHSSISPSMAKCLNITPLSEELDVSEDTFSDAGQYEPLTVRLKNILKDYKDGISIVKELIQNADDAEASEINICFDARNHKLEQKTLFFPGMHESHGPALVVHSNSTFSNEDFDNIQKLAAATKQRKEFKIGKFGIGFCSVYHITDVPSFISRSRMYIFDPTLKYLRKEVKNPTQSGKMVKFLSTVIQNSCQLSPYQGLFGFKRSTEFDGTIFRLPFRNFPSELSSTCYKEAHVEQLFEEIKQCGNKLLLFLQHVKKITFQQIEESQSHPKLLYELSKNVSSASLQLDQTFLTSKVNVHEKNLVDTTIYTTCTNWLVTEAIISSRSTDASRIHSKPAVASVACLLSSGTDSSNICCLKDELNGETFCYLPLSETTGLPVHISCNFAVLNNRRGIWTSTEDSSPSETEIKWNIYIMTEVIPIAYIGLLCSLRDMHIKGSLQKYQFHSLWPLHSKLQMKNPWEKFVSAFYKILISEELLYSEVSCSWLTMDRSKFIEDDILCNSGILPCVIHVLSYLKFPLVNLPSSYRHQLPLDDEIITEKNFVDLFFSKLTSLNDQNIISSRNEVLFHMLEAYIYERESSSPFFHQLSGHLRNHACIPCAPHGNTLKKCIDLVYPESQFAELFDKSEGRFPTDILLKKPIATEAMKDLGMRHDSIPWNLVIEKTHTISTLMQANSFKALQLVKSILTTITKHVSGEPPTADINIDSISFLPVLRKPENYPLVWHGDDHQLLCGKELMISGGTESHIQNTLIAGSQVSYVCELTPDEGGCSIINEKVQKILHLRSSPTCSEVLAHLKKVVRQQSDTTDKEWVTKTCEMIFDFLESAIQSDDTKVDLSEMKTIPCIWNGCQFLRIDFIAEQWKLENGPYFYSVPHILANKRKLMEYLGIKSEFSKEDAQECLRLMKRDFGDKPVSEECQHLITELISIFSKAFNSDNKKVLIHSDLYLPDENLRLHKSTELAYNDTSWAPKDKDYIYVYNQFPRDLAKALDVQMRRSKVLDKYISKEKYFGTKFGQHEDLTQRIQNILRDYPFDITILKELLQNADDARAKKIYFILDKRTHGKESLISENWQKLQGPALLVWNDSIFSEKDLQGIQKLGLGSKRSEAETIGQYGVGFNVVYHLTDCPSFITGGETLCIMDPHCQYVDGATESSPGEKFDNLDEGFWKRFSDMSSPFLKVGLDNNPEELQGGSLFRFPIRHSEELVRSSKISDKYLTEGTLSEELNVWMPKMKSAMFFLNSITEIKYMVIEPDSTTLETVYHFQSQIPDSTKFEKDLDTLKSHISCFGDVWKPSTALYPLIITELNHDKQKKLQEKWLVQQGIGDIRDRGKVWQYVKKLKPRHGIVAPMKVTPPFCNEGGQLFCFLPLPVSSQVPVHVSGSFMLDSTRRNLWNSTNPNEMDNKSKWNNNLFQAISSSYANFLVKGKQFYLDPNYGSWKTALNDLNNFCQLFPSKEKDRYQLFCNVFKTLVQDNAKILCVFVPKKKHCVSKIATEWYPLVSECEANQVYFWNKASVRNIIHPVLESLGMKITSASDRLRKNINAHISEDQPDIPVISCSSVFKYYTEYSNFTAVQGMKSQLLSHTVFCDVKTFVVFLKYLLNIPLEALINKADTPHKYDKCSVQKYSRSQSDKPASTRKFPESPFSHFLLLSADGMLKIFDEDHKIFSSNFIHLFPALHQDKFLHPSLRCLELHSSYFICPCNPKEDNTIVVNLFLEIFKDTFHSKMLSENVIQHASSFIRKKNL